MQGPFFELVYFHEESEHTKEWLKKADESLKWIQIYRENERIWLRYTHLFGKGYSFSGKVTLFKNKKDESTVTAFS